MVPDLLTLGNNKVLNKCVMKLLNKDGQKEGECMKLKEKQTSERKIGVQRLQHGHWKRKLKQCS